TRTIDWSMQRSSSRKRQLRLPFFLLTDLLPCSGAAAGAGGLPLQLYMQYGAGFGLGNVNHAMLCKQARFALDKSAVYTTTLVWIPDIFIVFFRWSTADRLQRPPAA